jgi:hypothetical protein
MIYSAIWTWLHKAWLLLVAIALLHLVVLANDSVAQSEGDGLLPHIDEYGIGDPIYVEVQRIADFFAARLGLSLGRPVVVFGDYSSISLPTAPHGGQLLAVTIPVKPFPDPTRAGHRKWDRQVQGSNEGLNTCGIFLSVGVTAVSRFELKNALAHEIFHCFQMKIAGIDRPFELPQWISEGTASFAGEDYTQYGSPLIADRWNRYLGEQKSVYDGDYDAMGFFFHLKSQGANVYRAMRLALLSESNAEAMLVIRGEAGNRAFSLWPTGLARLSRLGPEWDTNGPAITSASRAIGSELVQDYAAVEVVSDAGEQKLFELSYPDRQVLVLSISGYGGIVWDPERTGVETMLFDGSHNGRYCAKNTCRCDDGSLPDGISEVAWSGGDFPRALVGISGSEAVAVFRATVEDFECDEEPAASCPLIILNSEERRISDTTECGGLSGAAADCLAGIWRQDAERYVDQLRELLPPGAVVTRADNTTTIAIASDGIAQTCIKFSAEIEMPGNLPIRTETTAEGATVVKLGTVAPDTLCALPVREEVVATARTNIGGMVSSQPIVLTGAFGRRARFTCSGEELIIFTPTAGVGDVVSRFLRIQ